jgi:hemerythrin-like domain-containing protein
MKENPVAMLEAEHRVIEKMVSVMAMLASDLEVGRPVDTETLRNIVGFLRTYADKYHHGKEEVHLFPVLAAKGVPVNGCPLGALMGEHQEGRGLVAEFAQGLEAHAAASPSSREALAQTLHSLVELYLGHIWKEDYLLFPMTNKVLSPKEQAALYVRFEAVDRATDQEVPRRFEQPAANLEAKLKAT